MEFLYELLKIALPAMLVLYAMYLTTSAFLTSQMEQVKADLQGKVLEKATKTTEQTLLLRFQAYERLCLFLERISPPQLIPRINNPAHTVLTLQQVLITEIRNEFAYNLSQQVYVSNEAWTLIQKAVEEMMFLINNSTVGLDEDAPGIDLAKRLLENAMQHDINPAREALDFLKEEVRNLF